MKSFLGLSFIAIVMILAIAVAAFVWYLNYTTTFSR